MINIITQLNTLISTSSPSDISFIFASYVRGNLNSIENMSIDEIAQVCNTSSSSISRLVSKMGYSSYKAFRKDCINALESIRLMRNNNNEYVQQYGLMPNTIDRFFNDQLIPLLKETKTSDLEKMFTWCNQSHLYLYGTLEIRFILEELQARLSGGKYGAPIVISDLNSIQSFGKNDCLIVFSVVGNSINDTKSIEYLKKCKAKKYILKTTLNTIDSSVFDDSITLYSNINNGIINNYLIRFFIDMSFNLQILNHKK